MKLSNILSRIFGYMGYIKHRPMGAAISTIAQSDLDYIFEKTGFKSHKVDPEFRFNSFFKTNGDPEACKIEELMLKYSGRGYVFTNDGGLLVGNICSIVTKEDRVTKRRKRFKIVQP